MIWPPLGPGTLASMGSGVSSGVGSGEGAALTAAPDGAALGAVEAVLPPQAAATTAMMATRAIKARGPDRDWFIAIDSSCARSSAISYLSLMRPKWVGPDHPRIGARRSPAGSGHAPPGARGAFDELRGEDHASRRAIRTFDGVDEQAGHLLAHLLDGLTDTRQGRLRGGRDRRVVVADQGDVLGDASTGGRQHRECPGGHEVRGGEDGIDVGAGG